MHKFKLVKPVKSARTNEQKEKQEREAQLSAPHTEAGHGKITKEKYGIEYSEPPRLGVIGNTKHVDADTDRSVASVNTAGNDSHASRNSVRSGGSQSLKYPTSPTNRPSYLYGAISPEDSRKFTEEIETRVLKQLSTTAITRPPEGVDPAPSGSAVGSGDPNDPDPPSTAGDSIPLPASMTTTGEVMLNYPIKLPEARFQMMELHVVLDNMLADMRHNQSVLMGAGGESVHSSLTSATMPVVLFGGASSRANGGGDVLSGGGSMVTAGAESMTTAGGRSIGTNVGGSSTSLTGSPQKPASMGVANPNLRRLDGSVSGLEEKAKKFSFDMVLADLVNQALMKARRLRAHYRKYLVALESEYQQRTESGARALAIAQKRLRAFEKRAKSHNKRGLHLIEEAMHTGANTKSKGSARAGYAEPEEEGDLENPALVLPEIASYLRAHEHDTGGDTSDEEIGNRRRKSKAGRNKPSRLVLDDADDDSSVDSNNPRATSSGGEMMHIVQKSASEDPERGRTAEGERDGEPDVAELLAHQLKAERISSNKRLQELSMQVALLQKRFDGAVAHNRKMEEELDDKEFEVDDLKERLQRFAAEREKEVAELNATIVSNKQAATQHMRDLLNSIPVDQQRATAASAAPSVNAQLDRSMSSQSAVQPEAPPPMGISRQNSRVRAQQDATDSGPSSPAPLAKTLTRQSTMRVVSRSDSAAPAGGPAPLQRRPSMMMRQNSMKPNNNALMSALASASQSSKK